MGATVIDALLVTLGLDSSGFKQGAKDADKAQTTIEQSAKRTAKTLGKTEKDTSTQRKRYSDTFQKQNKQAEAEAKKVAEAIGQIRNQVIALFAVFTAGRGLKDFVASLTSSDAALGRNARNLGIGANELGKWQKVAEQLGGTAEDVTSSFQRITAAAQEQALTGTSPLTDYWRRLNIEWADGNSNLKDMGALALEVADKFQQLKLSAPRAQAIGQELGYSEGFVNILQQGRQATEAYLAAAKAANDEDVAAAQKRQAAFSRLTQLSEQLGRKIVTLVSPALETVLGWLINIVDFLTEHQGVAVGVFTALTVAATIFSAALLGPVALAVGGVIALAGISLPLVAAIAVAVGAISTAAYELYDDWDTVVYGLGELWDGFIDKITHPLATLKSWIDEYLEFTGRPAQGTSAAPAPAVPEEPSAGTSAAPAPAVPEEPSAGTSAAPAPAVPEEPSAGTSAGAAPRGLRNNNPGNLDYAGQTGASPESQVSRGHRFAVFQSLSEGIAALARQLQLYAGRGNDTIRGIISKFAPPGENNTEAYIKSVMKILGVGDRQHLDLKNPNVLREMIRAITSVEVGAGRVNYQQIQAGLAYGFQRGSIDHYSTAHAETNIGVLNVQTQATDADGIAQRINKAIEQYSFVPAANTGLN